MDSKRVSERVVKGDGTFFRCMTTLYLHVEDKAANE